ncbi:MAG: hypothetical protein IKZ21_02340 [Clostridia bacterium]|nr:hypothetical protein [Clostridia bacterium]
MADEKDRAAQALETLMGRDARGKMMKILPLLAGEDGKRLMGLLYLSGSSPEKLKKAMEKAAAGDGTEARMIISTMFQNPEGERILSRLLAALES